MQASVATGWLLAVLLLSVRLAPVMAYAPPFVSLKIPRTVRAAIVLALATALAPMARLAPELTHIEAMPLIAAMTGEIVMGAVLAYALQTAFGAFHIAGRILDTQGGLSLAVVIDPSSPGPSPLLGTLLTLVAGAVFFANDGHHDLLRLVAASLQAVPAGSLGAGLNFEAFIAQAAAMTLMGITVAGASMVVLFLCDIALAVMSRNLPQMNILVLGLQVKGMVLIVALGVAAGSLAPLVLRSVELAFNFVGRALVAG